MRIFFDGGYNDGLGVGTWAVVLVRDCGAEVLLEYGHVYDSKSTDVEWLAARKALEYARWLGVGTIIGDYKACIKAMQRDHPRISWRWIRSRGNVADKWTKYYPELEDRCGKKQAKGARLRKGNREGPASGGDGGREGLGV